MSNNGTSMAHKMERAAVSVIVDKILKDMDKDRTAEYMKLIDYAEKFYGKDYKKEDYDKYRKLFSDPNNSLVKIINSFLDEGNPHVVKVTLMNLLYEAFFAGTKQTRKNREKYDCNIPWLILFDPTDACNMHCVGCWSGEYGHKNNLSYEDMDKIVTEGKALGVHLYMMTGGEPLVRKADILKLAEKHNDCEFSLYTNSTLIDEDLCKECVRLGNIAFQLSIEGSEETNDARRGKGHYKAVMNAMKLLKKYGILFGGSICYTRANVEAVTSDEFVHMLADNGMKYVFYFHFMPVGKGSTVDLMPTVEQRKYMIKRIREIRKPSYGLGLFPMDFQNDGEYVGGCIAGGRNYFHINASGEAEPCVFIHYSNANIHDSSILEILKSPLFMAYHYDQPFNENHLRPCPMLENPEVLGKLVKETGAHNTDKQAPETPEELAKKTVPYAEKWKPEAEKIWKEENKGERYHKTKGRYLNYSKEYMAKLEAKEAEEEAKEESKKTAKKTTTKSTKKDTKKKTKVSSK